MTYIPDYRPLHHEMWDLRIKSVAIDRKLAELNKDRNELPRDGTAPEEALKQIDQEIAALKKKQKGLKTKTPVGWKEARKRYVKLRTEEEKARRQYHRNVDDAYEQVTVLRDVISGSNALIALESRIKGLKAIIANDPPMKAMAAIKSVEKAVGAIAGTSKIKSKLSRARRALKGDKPKRDKAAKALVKGLKLYAADVAWRHKASAQLAPGFADYDNAIKNTIGLRLQERLTNEQAEAIASCQSIHRDISLDF